MVENFDRAAPRGVGNIKAAGNYAPDVAPHREAKAQGYPVCLYLDSKENAYVEEFSTSNFIGVTADGTVITPTSASILPSCTKGVVLQQARELGYKVEERPVPWEEVGLLKEVAACGTAVVLTPIKSIARGDKKHHLPGFDTIAKLYEAVTKLQRAEAPDLHGLTRVVCARPRSAARPRAPKHAREIKSTRRVSHIVIGLRWRPRNGGTVGGASGGAKHPKWSCLSSDSNNKCRATPQVAVSGVRNSALADFG